MSTQIKSSISYTPFTDDLLQDIVRQIVAAFDPETVILFGSRAHGEATKDSNIDLLVSFCLETPFKADYSPPLDCGPAGTQ